MSYCVTLFDTIENPSENDACFIAATKNLTINKGSSYKIVFVLSKNGNNNIDLLGHSLRGEIKQSSTSSEVLLSLTSANLLLEIDNANSRINMYLKETFTNKVNVSSAVYNIELLDSIGNVSKIITGLITFI